MYVERQVYKNAKMFITASCLCYIFDQAWTWFQSTVMKKQLSMTDNSCDNLTSLMRNLEGSDQTALYSRTRRAI